MNFFASSGNSSAGHAEVPHTFYQIDYASANCGRIVPMSKRRIRFKYGYTNMPAIYDGLSGQDCRGAEHEVSIMWSLSSGKQSIQYDGEVVYVNVCDLADGKMTHSWHDKDGHYLKVIVHSLSTSLKQTQDAEWRQYDLFIDGISYFKAPKIFEIGVFSKRNAGDCQMECNVFEQPTATKFDEAKSTEVVDLLSFDDIPVTPTQQVQTVTPSSSPHDNNAILFPFMGANAPQQQQQYTNYAF
mmetsp:Transcript_31767/g.47451  ORF Transcript_31767/g.47451 Transcript_31767/m.47451 type:complete len:242 (-) Transcript_31767:130-855(-)